MDIERLEKLVWELETVAAITTIELRNVAASEKEAKLLYLNNVKKWARIIEESIQEG